MDPDHADISLLTIDEISGILDHSAACEDTNIMNRDPPMALHPELRAYALSLIKDNIPKTQLQQLCRRFAESQWPNQAGSNTHRYLLSTHETSSLYRTAACELGVPQRSAAAENLDRWFRAKSPAPPAWTGTNLTDSCLHYEPCIDGISDRFIIIIATQEQRKMAWKHGHKRQMLLDLTFGTCSARALTGILMALDDKNRGIPVAFFKFTARKETKATHADYDGQLLERILRIFKSAMGTNSEGEEFDIAVANTDNDARERNALAAVWPNARLILCMFHVWQAWRNALNRYLKVVPQGEPRQEIRNRLGRFLMRQLKEIDTYAEAVSSLSKEFQYVQSLAKKRDQLSKKTAKGARNFLNYFHSYIKIEPFWKAWSCAGISEAAHHLGIPENQVPRTTNHLESFNGRIKNKFFAQYQHGGRLPRIDVWILVLIMKVIPTFFTELADHNIQMEHYHKMRHAIPREPEAGSHETTAHIHNPTKTINLISTQEVSIAYQIMDDISIDNTADDSDSDPDNRDELDEMISDGNQHQLVLASDGKSSIFVPCPDPENSDWEHADFALDEDDICCDLRYPSRSPVSLPPDSPVSASTVSSNLSQRENAQATAMQELLVIHDSLVEVTRRLLDLNIHPEKLDEYITSNGREQLSQEIKRASRRKSLTASSRSSSSSPVLSRSISISPSIEFNPELSSSPLEQYARGQNLLSAFEPQKKEKRKVAHGIR